MTFVRGEQVGTATVGEIHQRAKSLATALQQRTALGKIRKAELRTQLFGG